MNIYESISKFFVENPTKIFLLFIFTTIGLILSYLFIPYRGDASTSPNDPIIDLDKKISLEFSDEAHFAFFILESKNCLLYTSPSPRDLSTSRMPSSA